MRKVLKTFVVEGNDMFCLMITGPSHNHRMGPGEIHVQCSCGEDTRIPTTPDELRRLARGMDDPRQFDDIPTILQGRKIRGEDSDS